MVEVTGLGVEAYVVDRAIRILVAPDTALSVFVPGGKDAAQAVTWARALAEKALARLRG